MKGGVVWGRRCDSIGKRVPHTAKYLDQFLMVLLGTLNRAHFCKTLIYSIWCKHFLLHGHLGQKSVKLTLLFVHFSEPHDRL